MLILCLGFAWAQNLELHFIDVGQGDSVLIRSPSGQNVLYDGGRGEGDALAYLQSVGIKNLNLVIASHPDADHIGGLAAVVRFYKPRLFMDNDLSHTTQTYFGLLEAVRDAGSQLIPPTSRHIGLGDASLQILPPPGDESLGNNDNSVGVIVSYGEFDAAFTGDAEQAEFSWWQANVPRLLHHVEVYKSSHHGSPNGDSPASIETFHPKAVVISVGVDNAYGHPSPAALALYESVSANIYRTDQSGTVIVSATADGLYTVNAQHSAAPEIILTEPLKADPIQSLPFDPLGEDKNCGDFSSQSEAQEFYEAAGGPEVDPHRLDGDNDGGACNGTSY